MTEPLPVLVADDDPTTTLIVAAALRQWNCTVTIVHDGGAARRHLQADRPPMAILDWMMPVADGPTLCREIRQDPACAGMYVVLLTARTAREDLVAGLDAGADDYLTKPVDREELRARVHVGKRIVALQRGLRDRVAELQTALAAVTQLEGLLRLCSYCKRVRTEEDSWHQLERYIAERSDTQFSHGICPECLERVRKDFEG